MVWARRLSHSTRMSGLHSSSVRDSRNTRVPVHRVLASRLSMLVLLSEASPSASAALDSGNFFALDHLSSWTYVIFFALVLERRLLRAKVTEGLGSQVSTRPQQHVLPESRALSCRPTHSAHEWVSQRRDTVLQLFSRHTPTHSTPPPTAIPRLSDCCENLCNLCSSPTTPQASLSNEGFNRRFLPRV